MSENLPIVTVIGAGLAGSKLHGSLLRPGST